MAVSPSLSEFQHQREYALFPLNVVRSDAAEFLLAEHCLGSIQKTIAQVPQTFFVASSLSDVPHAGVVQQPRLSHF